MQNPFQARCIHPVRRFVDDLTSLILLPTGIVLRDTAARNVTGDPVERIGPYCAGTPQNACLLRGYRGACAKFRAYPHLSPPVRG